MAHLTPDRLAALASTTPADPAPAAPEPGEREHLSGCPTCRSELAGLEDLDRTLRLTRASDLREPTPAVWARIEEELDADARTETAVPAGSSRPTGPASGGPVPAGRRRSRHSRAWVAVAAASGLLVGVGATLGVVALRQGERTDLVARTDLAAVPGEAGGGSAELVRTDDTLQLRVHARLGPSPSQDFHEVWLLNADGRRMYALGVLPSSGDGRYWLPTSLSGQLAGYRTVDISLEPEDGDAAHSQHSLVRGRLPA